MTDLPPHAARRSGMDRLRDLTPSFPAIPEFDRGLDGLRGPRKHPRLDARPHRSNGGRTHFERKTLRPQAADLGGYRAARGCMNRIRDLAPGLARIPKLDGGLDVLVSPDERHGTQTTREQAGYPRHRRFLMMHIGGARGYAKGYIHTNE